jgi:hypothetical protein
MINLFVTYRCNLACSYCFARELQAEFPQDLSKPDFTRLLDWMRRAAVPSVAFIGGEPTLHPGLADMVEQTATAGIAVVLFSNGLFSEKLAEQIAPHVSNFVINYNEPSLYAPAQKVRLAATLGHLRDRGGRIVFSKNFSKKYNAFEYLLEGCERYGVRSVRYDISRPSRSGANDYFTDDDTPKIISHVVDFVKACEVRGIKTGLDCSVKLCDLRVEDRNYLERVSMKFSGVCHPSMDIHPDLSASYCLPLREVTVPDVTIFANQEALMWHFAELVRPMRRVSVSHDCLDCKDFMRRCQGGCLALRRLSGVARADAPLKTGCGEG